MFVSCPELKYEEEEVDQPDPEVFVRPRSLFSPGPGQVLYPTYCLFIMNQ
jgi:hypothetical protein